MNVSQVFSSYPNIFFIFSHILSVLSQLEKLLNVLAADVCATTKPVLGGLHCKANTHPVGLT